MAKEVYTGPATSPLPTALFHLLAVELVPVWGYGISILSAGRKFMSHELLGTIFMGTLSDPDAQHRSSRSLSAREASVPPTVLEHMSCLDNAITDFMVSKSMAAVSHCPGCGDRLFCKRAFLPAGIVELLYCALALNALLVAWILASFLCAGLLRESFGSGAYLQFTWSLEQSRVYRIVAWVMALATAITLAMIALVALVNGNPLSIVQFVGFEAVALFLCLKRLLVPKTRIYLWLRPGALDGVLFARPWRSLFLQANDTVAAQLTDGLWQARCGSRKFLRRLLASPDAAESVLQLCSRLQSRDDGDSSEEGASEDRELQPRSSDDPTAPGVGLGASVSPARGASPSYL